MRVWLHACGFAGFCVQCVSVTNCGNFGLAGFSTGAVHMFNMQSGLYRGSFGDPSGKCDDGEQQHTCTHTLNYNAVHWLAYVRCLLMKA